MGKIIVVDGEQILIEQMIDLINCEINDARVVGYAKTGRGGVERARETKPNIIIVEIKLAELNGLEVIKLIKEFIPEVHIIILTEYKYFEFAKEAIALGVDEYLIKPLNKRLFLNAINCIMDKIKEENKKERNQNTQREKLKDALEFAGYSFIYSVLFNSRGKEDIGKYEKVLDLSGYGYIMNLEILKQFPVCLTDMTVKTYDIEQCIRRTVPEEKKIIIGPRIVNTFILFIQNDCSEINECTQRKESVQLANTIVERLKVDLGLDSCVGIGTNKQNEKIHSSYEEALKASHFDKECNIVHNLDVKDKTLASSGNYKKTENKLIESIKLGKNEALGYFYELLSMTNELSTERKKNKVLELLGISAHAALAFGSRDDSINYMNQFEELKSTSDKDVDTWAIKKFNYIYKTLRISKHDKISEGIESAIEYIEVHYNEEIFLEEISRYVSITPQYFSKLFKDETGYNFVEWITKIRIEKAKELMNSTDKKIKEVCYLVGYNDPNYFSRAFKKIAGVSPTDYMKGKGVELNH